MKMKCELKIIFFSFLILLLVPSNVYAEEIPNWIKTITVWWIEGEVTDGEFIDAMEYIFEKNLIYINPDIENDFLRTVAINEIQQKTDLFETTLNLRAKLIHFLSDVIEEDYKTLSSLQNEKDVHLEENILKKKMIDRFQEFVESDKNIEQIRILDMSGMEITRINNINGNLQTVSDHMLQDKSHRDYFSEILKLDSDDIYISKIDLNEEFGQIEMPYNPTIRMGAIIHNSSNENKGILIINYDVDELLSKLSQSTICNTVIFDQQGTVIQHYDEKKEFGKQLETNYSYFDDHREILLGKIADLEWYHDRLNQMTIIKHEGVLEHSENNWHIVCELK
mgnify:CR=1 FL=1|jgi:hypothetical protein